ncbi:Uncharacterised protein [Vibrio cholerae]|nr:Uncharacterised protein [Vibrio cholerae]
MASGKLADVFYELIIERILICDIECDDPRVTADPLFMLLDVKPVFGRLSFNLVYMVNQLMD